MIIRLFYSCRYKYVFCIFNILLCIIILNVRRKLFVYCLINNNIRKRCRYVDGMSFFLLFKKEFRNFICSFLCIFIIFKGE